MIFENRVGVLATTATVISNAYKNEIQAYRPGTFVLEKGCPDLVPLIESGNFES